MMTMSFRSSTWGLLEWQFRRVFLYSFTGLIAWVLIKPLGLTFIELPVLPITIMGSAIGIFASFHTNQAYERWWEGRKLWGRMINSSRHWSTQVLSYLPASESALSRQLVMRHASYVHALRCLLRKQDPFAAPAFQRTLVPGDEDLQGSTNLTHALLHRQMAALTELARRGELNELRLQSFDHTVLDLLNIQGGCERIKGTPLPRGYAFIVDSLIRGFSIMLPMSLVHELDYGAIPLNVVICLAFALITEAGRVLEDPFSLYYNGLPLNNLSTKIERNIRERVGGEELPPDIQAVDGILM